MAPALESILVNGAGAAALGVVFWHSWLPRLRGESARSDSGIQSVLIVVRGGYTPDTVILERGRRARLIFRREESDACSERVVLPAFAKSALLPRGVEVGIEFVPKQRGEFPFSCHMGVLRGRIVVE